MSLERAIFRYLDTNGDGTGTKQAIGNYAGAAEEFKIMPPDNQIYSLNRMIVLVEDTANMQAEEYGNLGVALTVGIVVQLVRNGTPVVDLTDGFPIKTNAQWARLCYDADIKTWGAGDELLAARWTFGNSGKPFLLRGGFAEELIVTVADNMTGLIDHTFAVQGFIA